MGLPYHVWYRLTRRHMDLAAEVSPSRPDRRAWIAVYPLNDSKYNVKVVEVDEEILDRSVVSDSYLCDADAAYVDLISVHGEDELARVLTRWLPDLEQLVQPDFCDYPL
jgi:hypothetical protein